MHWTADHLVLWQSPVTRPSLLSAHIYYSHTLVSMPEYFIIGQYAVGTLGGVMLLAKALGGRESNWLFDGASLCECIDAVLLMFHSTRSSPSSFFEQSSTELRASSISKRLCPVGCGFFLERLRCRKLTVLILTQASVRSPQRRRNRRQTLWIQRTTC